MYIHLENMSYSGNHKELWLLNNDVNDTFMCVPSVNTEYEGVCNMNWNYDTLERLYHDAGLLLDIDKTGVMIRSNMFDKLNLSVSISRKDEFLSDYVQSIKTESDLLESLDTLQKARNSKWNTNVNKTELFVPETSEQIIELHNKFQNFTKDKENTEPFEAATINGKVVINARRVGERIDNEQQLRGFNESETNKKLECNQSTRNVLNMQLRPDPFPTLKEMTKTKPETSEQIIKLHYQVDKENTEQQIRDLNSESETIKKLECNQSTRNVLNMQLRPDSYPTLKEMTKIKDIKPFNQFDNMLGMGQPSSFNPIGISDGLTLSQRKATQDNCSGSVIVVFNETHMITTVYDKMQDIKNIKTFIQKYPQYGFKIIFETSDKYDVIKTVSNTFHGVLHTSKASVDAKLAFCEKYIKTMKESQTDSDESIETEENTVCSIMKDVYVLSDNIEHRMKAQDIFDYFNSMSAYLPFKIDTLFRNRLSKYLIKLGLTKKRYSDGYYYYGIIKRDAAIKQKMTETSELAYNPNDILK